MDNVTQSRAGRREWIGLAVLALPTLLLSLDVSVLYLALPSLSEDLGASSTQQLWIMDVYGFMIAGFLVTAGRLGDRIGRRRLLLIGAAAFSVASVVAAFSVNAQMLIGARAVLGVAGSTLMPSTLALISTMFRDARQRGVAISVWMTCFMGGMAVGPVLGGVLLETFWWGAAFLMGVPAMALLLALGPVLLPEYSDPDAGRLDIPSVALSLAAVLSVIYGLKDVARHGWGVVPVAMVVLGLCAGAAFVRRQRRLASPLLDLGLFANRTFRAALMIWLVFGAVQGGSFLFFALYLQTVVGLSPLSAGLWLVLPALAMIVGTTAAPVIARWFHPGTVIAAGLAMAAVGYLVLTRLDSDGGVTVLMIGLTITLLGLGPAAALGTELIVGSAPPSRAGSAAAVSETSGELGIALGVATLGSVVGAIYRGQLADAIPAGVPADAADAARESVTGAVAAATHLPELLVPAREAFTTAVTGLSWLSALVFAGLAVLAAATLRGRPAAPAEPSQVVEAETEPEQTLVEAR